MEENLEQWKFTDKTVTPTQANKTLRRWNTFALHYRNGMLYVSGSSGVLDCNKSHYNK